MKSQYALDPADVVAAFEGVFLGKLLTEIGKTHFGKKSSETIVQGKNEKSAARAVNMSEVVEEDFNEDENLLSDNENEELGEKTAKEQEKERMNDEEQELEESDAESDDDGIEDKEEIG